MNPKIGLAWLLIALLICGYMDGRNFVQSAQKGKYESKIEFVKYSH